MDKKMPVANSASVKVMRSHDYCHFEIQMGVVAPEGQLLTIGQIDELRKDAARLADKAVEQYQIAKREANNASYSPAGRDQLRRQVQVIRENFPQSEWTPEQKAKVKALEDYEFRLNHCYDYDDDWDFHDPDSDDY